MATRLAKETRRSRTGATKTAPLPRQAGTAAEGVAADTQLVTFLVKDEEFGFNIMAVQEIIRLPKVVRLPHAPSYMEGVTNLRGTLLPIVDLRTRFGMEREARTDRSRVLVVDIEGRRTGLLVDGVRQVTRVDRREMSAPPPAIRNTSADYIEGVVKMDGGSRIVFALDARKVCAFDGQPDTDAGEQRVAGDGIAEAGPADGSSRSGTSTRGKGGNVQQLVSFKLGREEFAFSMQDVREILRVHPPKEVPGGPEHLMGVLTVRGQILPIVDLRRLLRQSSFAEDHRALCRAAVSGCREWLAHATTNVTSSAGGDLLASHGVALDRMRQWMAEFNSSSQALMEIVARVRSLTDLAQGKLAVAAGTLRPELRTELVNVAGSIVRTMEGFEEKLAAHLSEDQRIIVVESDGVQLGLVVDDVNEVLNVSEDAIEAPPELAHHEGVQLSGIAKLDDGNRLILLLATSNLLGEHRLSAIADGDDGDAGEAAGGEGAKDRQESDETQLVTFLLGEEEYGIPIARIQEIDRLARITRTPKAPRYVEGITNLRGEVIPVLSTRSLFGLDRRASDDRTRVIIVDLGGVKTGMVVDSVRQVLSIASRDIVPPPANIGGGGDQRFISGVGKAEEGRRMVVLLDLSQLLTGVDQQNLAALRHAA